MNEDLKMVAIPKEFYYHEIAYVESLKERIAKLEESLALSRELRHLDNIELQKLKEKVKKR